MTLLVTAALTTAVFGCRADEPGPQPGPTPGRSGLSYGGPLSVGDGGGGHVSLPAARGGRAAVVVFGGLVLCTSDGRPVTLQAIRHESAGSAVVQNAIRRIPAAADRDDPDPMQWSPIIALRGALGSARLRAQMRGTVVGDIAGVVVADRCGTQVPWWFTICGTRVADPTCKDA